MKMTEPRKIENAKEPNEAKKEVPIPEESCREVLYQILKCNILRGLVMFFSLLWPSLAGQDDRGRGR